MKNPQLKTRDLIFVDRVEVYISQAYSQEEKILVSKLQLYNLL